MRSAVAGKPRVHELAKELGVDSKTVLAKLTEMGEYVKSASSTIEAPVARRLREVFVPPAASSAPAAPAGAPKSAARPAPPKKAAPAAPAVPAAPAARKTAAVPGPPPAAVKPTSAHDIEVAAAEARAPTLKAEQEAAVKAAQQRGPAPAKPAVPGPKPAAAPPAGRPATPG